MSRRRHMNGNGRRWRVGLVSLLMALGMTAASAPKVQAEPPSRAQPSAAGAVEPSILDASRRAPKAHRLLLQACGGNYLGASVGRSFITGGRAIFYVTRLLGVGAGYSYMRAASSNQLRADADPAMHVVNGQLETSIDSAMVFGPHTIVEADLYGIFGAGAMRIADTWKFTGVIGGGLRVYLRPRWLALNVEVLSFLHNTPRQSGTRFESDSAATLGLSVRLPLSKRN